MIQLISELNRNKYTIEIDLIIKCKTICDIINSLNILSCDINYSEKLFQHYRNKISNIDELENGAMNIDSNNYKIIEYFSYNFNFNNI